MIRPTFIKATGFSTLRRRCRMSCALRCLELCAVLLVRSVRLIVFRWHDSAMALTVSRLKFKTNKSFLEYSVIQYICSMKKDSQISLYQNLLAAFFKDQPVRRAYMFGSFVRGENKPGSDLDILVELEPGIGLFKFISIQNQLEIALKMQIDLVSANGLSPKIKPYIDSEKILVYEK